MNKIKNRNTIKTLKRLHKEASSQKITLLKGALKGIFRGLQPKDMEDAYISISKDQGEFIYDLLIKNKSTNIVEYGTSFGISTLYLGAAAELNKGKVITSELLSNKCKIATQNFKDAGLEKVIDLKEGDALQTLENTPNEIDFLLLDGWNDLYLPILKKLEPKFKKGTIIYTDNISFSGSKPFLEYITKNSSKYKTKRISKYKGGSELTTFIES